jgi:hypothetical protein
VRFSIHPDELEQSYYRSASWAADGSAASRGIPIAFRPALDPAPFPLQDTLERAPAFMRAKALLWRTPGFYEPFVTAGAIATRAKQIFIVITLAAMVSASSRGFPGFKKFPASLALFASLLFPIIGLAILLLRLVAPPLPCFPATLFTAIPLQWMFWGIGPRATLEQTLSRPRAPVQMHLNYLGIYTIFRRAHGR